MLFMDEWIMNIETRFNVGDEAYYLTTYVHGNPTYVKWYLFRDKIGRDCFKVKSVQIEVGDGYCNIDYRFEDFREIFIPSESNMFATRKEAMGECKRRNIKSVKLFRSLSAMSGESKTDEEDFVYENELNLLLS